MHDCHMTAIVTFESSLPINFLQRLQLKALNNIHSYPLLRVDAIMQDAIMQDPIQYGSAGVDKSLTVY